MGVLPDWMIERDIKITPFSSAQKRAGLISYGVSSYGYDVRLGYKGKIFTDVHGTVIDPKNFDPKALVEVDLTPTLHDMETNPGDPKYPKCVRCGTTHQFTNYTIESFPRQQCRGEHFELPHKLNFFLIPPNSFMLGESLEHFDIPRDVLCVVVGKSTYARCGLIVNVTPGEPEWKGHWTIEISNTTRCYAKVYAGEGIMQCLFFRSDGIREKLWSWFTNKIINRLKWLWGQDDAAEESAAMKDGTCRVSYADKKGKYQSQTGLTEPKVDGK